MSGLLYYAVTAELATEGRWMDRSARIPLAVLAVAVTVSAWSAEGADGRFAFHHMLMAVVQRIAGRYKIYDLHLGKRGPIGRKDPVGVSI